MNPYVREADAILEEARSSRFIDVEALTRRQVRLITAVLAEEPWWSNWRLRWMLRRSAARLRRLEARTTEQRGADLLRQVLHFRTDSRYPPP